MKIKWYLVGLMFFPLVMVSCYHGASDAELENYVNELLLYYPYSVNEEFVFVNDSTGQTWDGHSKNYEDGRYPYTYTWSCHEPLASCFSDWSASVEAMIVKDSIKDGHSELSTFIVACGGDPIIDWVAKIYFGTKEFIQADSRTYCTKEEVLSQLTDTIILPIHYHMTNNGRIDPAEGAYVRIIKGKGLTDFSVDSKSVWRRVWK